VAPLGGGPVAVVGLGAVGGSLALALRQSGVRVRGYAADERDREGALAAGVEVPAAAGVSPELLAGVVALVIAVPIEALAAVAAYALPMLPPAAVALHVAGLQRAAAVGGDDWVRARLIGTHPLAGTHEVGFAAARGGLFRGAAVSVESRADAPTRAIAESLWRAAGAERVEYRTAEEHDAQMAWVSHLPQLAATAVAGVIASRRTPASAVGPGARDTTRLAASPFPLWSEILARAPEDTTAALDALAARIGALREAVARRDRSALAALWEGACQWRQAATGQAP
jgi:prephenate dehydrogenase